MRSSLSGWVEKKKKEPVDPQDLDGRWGCFGAIIAALILGLSGILTKTPNSKGVEQPVIIVLIQSVFSVEVPGPTSTLSPISSINDSTPTMEALTSTPYPIGTPSLTYAIPPTDAPQPVQKACYCNPAGCDLNRGGGYSVGQTFHPQPESLNDTPFYIAACSEIDGKYYWNIVAATEDYVVDAPETVCTFWGYLSTLTCAFSEANRECNKRSSVCGGVRQLN
jgi:hypothetical protein